MTRVVLSPDYIEGSIGHMLPNGKVRKTLEFAQIASVETVLSQARIKGRYLDAYHAGHHAWLQARDHSAYRYGFVEVSEYREIKKRRSTRFIFTVRLTMRGRKALKVAKQFGYWCAERHRLDPVATSIAAQSVIDHQISFWESWALTILAIKHYRLRDVQGEIVRQMFKRQTGQDQFGKVYFVK